MPKASNKKTTTKDDSTISGPSKVPNQTYQPTRGPYKIGGIRRKTEQNIMAAATHVFSIKGFDGASIAEIAAHAKVPKANIYYYFQNKANLYQTLLKDILEQWDQVLNELDKNDNPAKALCHYIDTKMDFSRRHPEKSRVFAKEMLSGAPYLNDFLQQDYPQWFQSRVAIFEHWIQKGKISPIDPTHLLFMIWGSTQHYADFAPQIQCSLGLDKLSDDTFQQATVSIKVMVLRICGLVNSEVQALPQLAHIGANPHITLVRDGKRDT